MIYQKVANWKTWNDYVQTKDNSSFLNYSFWLDTYIVLPFLIRKIGFEIIDKNQIRGGISGIKFGFWKFSFIVFPAGPLFNSDISELEKKDFLNWFFSHEILNSKIIQFSTEFKLSNYNKSFNIGKAIKCVYLNSGFNLISLKGNEQEQLIEFKANVRRNINASLRRGLDLKQLDNESDLIKVYDVFKLNSIAANYKIRPFWFYKQSWIESLKSGQSIFLMAVKDSQIKGAIWLVDCGNRLHNVMGGTIKEKPELYVGYFLQWHVIKLSISKKYLTYNISVGGSEGVKRFKSDFGSRALNLNQFYCKSN